jgi:hypothetical protein
MQIDDSDAHRSKALALIHESRQRGSKITSETVSQCAKQPTPNALTLCPIVTFATSPKKRLIA